MKYTDNALNILTAKSYKGIGNAWIVKNLKGNENVETIVSLLNNTIKGEQTNEDEFEHLKNNFKSKIIEKFEEFCDGFVALGDPNFPHHRGTVKESEKPIFLYYKGKIDFITISLDDVEELNKGVPKFLTSMKATMPAYLLKTDDEEAAIASVTKDWQGGLPFTVLLNEKGEIAYIRQGKIKAETVRSEIDKIVGNASNQVLVKPNYKSTREEIEKYYFEKGRAEARTDVANGKYLIKRYGLVPGYSPELLTKLKKKYSIEIINFGCLVSNEDNLYGKGYNEISTAEVRRKFGEQILANLGF